jgi:hypothetical protein
MSVEVAPMSSRIQIIRISITIAFHKVIKKKEQKYLMNTVFQKINLYIAIYLRFYIPIS